MGCEVGRSSHSSSARASSRSITSPAASTPGRRWSIRPCRATEHKQNHQGRPMPASRLSPSSTALAGPLRRLALGLALAFGAVAGAQAQSLLELYEAARAYDATYLSS